LLLARYYLEDDHENVFLTAAGTLCDRVRLLKEERHGCRGTPVIMMVMSNQLVVAINASEIATAGSVPVQVQNPGGTGIYMNQPGPKSNIMAFTVQ
jgi:hypothetical protein